MKDHLNHSPHRGWLAFTLIELLVVIAIIATLAALLFPAGMAVRNKATIKRVQGEIAQVAQAIEAYKIEKGFYPPDNKVNVNPVFVRPYPNSLYYELRGANYGGMPNELFTTLDGSDDVSADELLAAFNTRGINNAGMAGNTDGPVAKNYLPDLKPAQYAAVALPGGDRKVLRTVVEGPAMVGVINPFLYVSSSPTNNPEKFDLWVDIIVGSKTNRISNWSDVPEIVSY